MKPLPVLATNVGLVVTPSRIPHSFAAFISSTKSGVQKELHE